jgi:hypothetical protein
VVVVARDRETARERILGVLYELPGPDGFRARPVGRIALSDALDELATMEGPTSDDAARRAYEARVASRAGRRGGGS